MSNAVTKLWSYRTIRLQRKQIQDDKIQKVYLLVNRCFEPSQPLGVISGLKKTFIKGYIDQRTNKAKIRPEEESEKT